MKFLYALAGMLMLATFAGCTEDGTDPDEPIICPSYPAIHLNETAVNLLSEGEKVSIEYIVENQPETGEIEAAADDEWLEVSVASGARLIWLIASRNLTGEDRQTTLRVNYPGANEVALPVTQSASADDFTIVLDRATPSTLTYSVFVRDREMTYISMIMEKSYVDDFPDDEDLYEDDLLYFMEQANIMQMSIEDYLASIFSCGDIVEQTVASLHPSTEYVLYCYGIERDGTRTTDIKRLVMSTAEAETGEVSFDLRISDEDALITVGVTPSVEGIPYYSTIMNYDLFMETGGDPIAAAQAEIDYLLELFSYYGYSASDMVEQMSYYGPEEYTVEGVPHSTYFALAFAWDENARIISDVACTEYVTGDVSPSDNVLTIGLGNATATTVDVSVTTTNSDIYFFCMMPSAYLEGMSEEQIVAGILENYGGDAIWNFLYTGDVEGTLDRLIPDTDYTALAFGYKSGASTTRLFTNSIRTLPGGDPADCTFEFSVSNVTESGASVRISPSDASVSYYWNIFEASLSDDGIRSYIAETSDFSGSVVQGEYSRVFQMLNSSTRYRVVAVAVDPSTRKLLGEIHSSEVFETGERIVSSAEIRISYKYYDGDELAAADPSYADCAGAAVMNLNAVVTGSVQAYYYTVFRYTEGLDDPAVTNDAVLIYNLENSGVVNLSSCLFALSWNTKMMIAAVARDFDGHYSKVYRQAFVLDRAGASPVAGSGLIGAVRRQAAFRSGAVSGAQAGHANLTEAVVSVPLRGFAAGKAVRDEEMPAVRSEERRRSVRERLERSPKCGGGSAVRDSGRQVLSGR